MQAKNLVIVGAGPGVSFSVAKLFGQHGFQVALIARRKAAVDKYAEDLQRSGVSAAGYSADAAKESDLVNVFAEIQHNYGPVDALVYNAAALVPGMPTTLTADRLVDEFRVNIAGALVAVQQVIPSMKERKEGTILFTGGGFAFSPYAMFASTSIGKAGLRSLAYTLGDELAPHGIFVGTVTIGGMVKAGTYYDPDRIAQAFYTLYSDKSNREIVYAEKQNV